MMLLSDFFEQLSYGELSHLYMGGTADGGIAQKDYEGIIAHINMGMTEIYSRFNLKQNVVTVQTFPPFTTYKIDSRYAASNPLNTDDKYFPKYVIDSESYPFTDDILLIEAVQDELGVWWKLNDESCGTAIMTQGHNIINVPYPSLEIALFVHYRARPEKVVLGDNSPSQIMLDIPPQFQSALLSYVAHRILAGQNAASPESQVYLAKFLENMNFIEQQGLRNKNELYNSRLECNGWV